MSEGYFSGLAVFLVDTLTSLYILALMLRFLFQWVEADFYNPISRFLVKITHPLLRPFRRLIPSIGRVDTASVVLMLGFQALDIFLVASLQQLNVSFPGLLLAAGWRLLDLLYDIYFYSILITVILSWFAPRGYNPAVALLFALTEPLLRLLRRILPPMGGVDLSPLLALIALQFTKMVVQPPLQQLIAMLN